MLHRFGYAANFSELIVLPVFRIEIMDTVIDHVLDFTVCPAAALLAVAAPAETLEIIDVSSRAALRYGSYVICLKQEIIA